MAETSAARKAVPTIDVTRPGSANSNSDCRPVLVLEVARGKTSQPMRPVRNKRFLIGAGEHCDMRLGGAGMPAIHSIILLEDGEFLLDSMAARPPLLINGQRQQTVVLRQGDQIQIGSFEMIVHIRQAVVSVPAETGIRQTRRMEVDHMAADAHAEHLDDLTAAELVDLIENDNALLEAFEGRRRMGANALLAAISSKRETLETVPTIPSKSTASETAPLHDVLHELQRVARELEMRSRRLSDREQHIADTAMTLLQAEQRLSMQLETILEQISRVRPGSGEPPMRAIA